MVGLMFKTSLLILNSQSHKAFCTTAAKFCRVNLLFMILFCVFIFNVILKAQTVYEPIDSDVYSFLDLMAQKGVISFNDQIQPVSRKYIAEKLQEVDSSSTKLTSLEMQELNFFKKDYYDEINFSKIDSSGKKYMSFFSKDGGGRFRVFSYSDKLFKLNFDPIIGLGADQRYGQVNKHFWSGVSLYGYIGSNIGFSFNYRDNTETGKTVDSGRVFTSEPGYIAISKNANNVEFSEIHATISYDWNWGDISVAKDYTQWGYGESGRLVLSDRAPSFPFIRLDISPVSWLRFNYFHAWLNSDVIDSSLSYSTYIPGTSRQFYRSKYMASHTLTIIPTKGLDFSLGESIIYTDKLQFSFLIPIMFFKLADNYLNDYNNNASGNSQFFFGVSSRNQIKNTHLYGTLFIDEISLENIFNPDKQKNQLGFSLGGSITDLPLENGTFTLEYTKIYPFVYTHYIPTETYTSSSFLLGDWMSNNADRIYASINYRILRGLQTKIWAQYIRKGSTGTPEQQYPSNTSQPFPPFLFGLKNYYTYFGFDVKYEFINDLFAELNFQSMNRKNEVSKDSYVNTRLNELSVTVYYGL
jgi:Capsule assembly protein Wzi